MPVVNIVKNTPIIRTPRVMQVEGLFDVAPSQSSEKRWTVDIQLPDTWHIGVIVGPSGSGKTTIAKALFGDYLIDTWNWPANESIFDGFPSTMSVKDIIFLLSSVGFSSPPSWLCPFHALSNGEQFRVTMARTLAEQCHLAVVDEFTSVIDRTVAQIGSAAIAKTVRKRKQQFVAVTCHYDVLDWLEPDWIYEPATDTFSVGRSLQRPRIELEIARVHSSAWQLFAKHHYLNATLHKSASCFCAFWRGTPVAFCAVLPFPHAKRVATRREHRLVCLPDYQGVGVGLVLGNMIASLCLGMGWAYIGSTGHPGMIASRSRSTQWRTIRPPSLSKVGRKTGAIGSLKKTQSHPWVGVSDRLTASFEYIGSAMDAHDAACLWHGRAVERVND